MNRKFIGGAIVAVSTLGVFAPAAHGLVLEDHIVACQAANGQGMLFNLSADDVKEHSCSYISSGGSLTIELVGPSAYRVTVTHTTPDGPVTTTVAESGDALNGGSPVTSAKAKAEKGDVVTVTAIPTSDPSGQLGGTVLAGGVADNAPI